MDSRPHAAADSGGEFCLLGEFSQRAGLRIDGPTQKTFSATTGISVSGTSTASTVHYALIMPGAVIEQGDIAVRSGKFQYLFDPIAVHARVPLYDIVSITTGKPQIGRVIHLTFFSEEKVPGGASFFDVARVILRGTTALSTRASIPAATTANPSLTTDVVGGSAVGQSDKTAAESTLVIAATEPETLQAWDVRIDRLIRDGALRVVSREEDTLIPGRSHERLQQFHHGVQIFGADLTRQTRNGITVSVFGRLRPDIEIEASPALDADDARAVIERHTSGLVSPGQPPTLVVLPRDEGGYALAWRVEARMEPITTVSSAP